MSVKTKILVSLLLGGEVPRLVAMEGEIAEDGR